MWQVLVSNLWDVRDWWSWLSPGYTTGSRDASLAAASFVSYENISGYRDFMLKAEPSPIPGGQAVGLWAKVWMTDAEYSYIGTVTTMDMWKDTVQSSRPPEPLDLTKTAQKTTREPNVKRMLQRLLRSAYAEGGQFSSERLADAPAKFKLNKLTLS